MISSDARPRRLNLTVLGVGLLIVLPMVWMFVRSFDFDPAYVESPLIGQPAPDFTLVDLDGNLYTLSELRGQPVVLNFWASYCPPCITEHPYFSAAAEHYRGRVHFFGVVYQDSEDNIRGFLRELGSWGPSLLDPSGKVAIAYGIYGPPETFFIDSYGIVQRKVISAVPPQILESTLDSML